MKEMFAFTFHMFYLVEILEFVRKISQLAVHQVYFSLLSYSKVEKKKREFQGKEQQYTKYNKTIY